MTVDAEVLILGGGCAGLSLAVALAERAPGMRVRTLESRREYRRDRTWCFWNTAPHPFSAAVTHRWSSWRVRHAGAEARQRSERYSYEHLPADRFYELAVGRLRASQSELVLGAAVRAVRQIGDVCEVETDRGVLRSRWVFDSRPPPAQEWKPVLIQRFTGWHVRAGRPCFDPSVVDLMDFVEMRPGAECGRMPFFYVLPFSATEALVEATYLDNPALAPADAEAALRGHLDRMCGADYEVLYREAGALPMGSHRASEPRRGRVLDIGTRGGRVKASSGYAFQRIQRQSAGLAEALARGVGLPRSFEPRRYGVLDRVFLEALRRSPDRAADYFMAMFRRLPADTLVRFLSETASWSEMLRVMLALPKFDFVQAAFPPSEASLR